MKNDIFQIEEAQRFSSKIIIKKKTTHTQKTQDTSE